MSEKTHPKVVRLIVTQYGPILGKDVVAKCVEFGFTNKKSTAAILFNAKKAGTIIKDEKDFWSVPRGLAVSSISPYSHEHDLPTDPQVPGKPA